MDINSHDQHKIVSCKDQRTAYLSKGSTNENGEYDPNYDSSQQTLKHTISQQQNPPWVTIGPLSPKRKVPVYVRSGQPFCSRLSYNQETSEKSHKARKSDPPSKKKCPMMSDSESARLSRRYYPREWERTDFGKSYESRPKSHQGFDFTIMSYNVLAQELLERHKYLYYKCYPSDLEWHNRWKLILDEIRFHSPDILCLQEVNKHHYKTYFKASLKPLGYKGTFFCRTGINTDGCATFFQTSKFHLKDTIPVPYLTPEGGQYLDKDNVALLVKLAPRSSSVPEGRLLCVANTHLLFNPRRGDIKLAQLTKLLAELDKHGHNDNKRSPYKQHGLIVCGDFNSLPESDIYDLIVRGKLSYTGIPRGLISGQERDNRARQSPRIGTEFLPQKVGIDRYCRYIDDRNSRSKESSDSTSDSKISGELQHRLKLVSAYDHFVARCGPDSCEVTTCHDYPCTVDYIFYNVDSVTFKMYRGRTEVNTVDEAQLQLIGHYGLITDTEFNHQGGIPNHKVGSDHLSIMAKFALR